LGAAGEGRAASRRAIGTRRCGPLSGAEICSALLLSQSDRRDHRLEALCEAGKISREDVTKRYEDALKKALERRHAESDEAREEVYLMKRRKELDADVEAGRMSEEMAKKLYEHAERVFNENTKSRAHLRKVKEELETQFEAGKISREESARRHEGALKAVQERMKDTVKRSLELVPQVPDEEGPG
jgi:hypothetical protein